jgi:uncharacterized membrane-anchored protein YitT (DUF2179 family)
MKRASLILLGVALLSTGVVWIFQGVGVLKGSFMTGQQFWAWMGAMAVLFSLPLLVRGWRTRGRRTTKASPDPAPGHGA